MGEITHIPIVLKTLPAELVKERVRLRQAKTKANVVVVKPNQLSGPRRFD